MTSDVQGPSSTVDAPSAGFSALHWILRVASAACFIAHGTFGFITKEAWIPFLSVVGVPRELGFTLMPLIAVLDISCGVAVLLRPRKVLLAYMIMWAALTAAIRPIVGLGMWEFFERAGNFGAPLALFLMAGPSRSFADWLHGFGPRALDAAEEWRLFTVLQFVTALLLIGHGGFGFVLEKDMLFYHWAAAGVGLPDVVEMTRITGLFEIALGLSILIRPSRWLVLFAFFWKVFTELLYPMSGDYFLEFVERFGSYGAPLALFLLLNKHRDWTIDDHWPLVSIRRIQRIESAYDLRSLFYGLLVAVFGVAYFGFTLSGVVPLTFDERQMTLKHMPRQIASGQELIDLLRGGGNILYIRHFDTVTKHVSWDELKWQHGRLELADFEDCGKQRALHKIGRERAREVGRAFTRYGFPAQRVLSSPYCRCIESGLLMTGVAPELRLSLIYRGREWTRERMETTFRELARELSPAAGENVLIYGHKPMMHNFGYAPTGAAAVMRLGANGELILVGMIYDQEWIDGLATPSIVGKRFKADTEDFGPPERPL
jgi:phosphohistidine phosphatase SixA